MNSIQLILLGGRSPCADNCSDLWCVCGHPSGSSSEPWTSHTTAGDSTMSHEYDESAKTR